MFCMNLIPGQHYPMPWRRLFAISFLQSRSRLVNCAQGNHPAIFRNIKKKRRKCIIPTILLEGCLTQQQHLKSHYLPVIDTEWQQEFGLSCLCLGKEVSALTMLKNDYVKYLGHIPYFERCPSF